MTNETFDLLFALIAGTAMGETCPDAPDHLADIDELIAQVQDATNQTDARRIGGEMWALWTDAPDGDRAIAVGSWHAAARIL